MKKIKKLLLIGSICALNLSFIMPTFAVHVPDVTENNNITSEKQHMREAINNLDRETVNHLHNNGVEFPENWYAIFNHRSLGENGVYEMVRFLINSGAKIEPGHRFFKNLMSYALYINEADVDIDTIRILHERDVPLPGGYSAYSTGWLHYLTWERQGRRIENLEGLERERIYEVIDYFVNNGATINLHDIFCEGKWFFENPFSPFHRFSDNVKRELLGNLLIDRIAIGDFKYVKKLLKYGADTNYMHSSGKTALQIAEEFFNDPNNRVWNLYVYLGDKESDQLHEIDFLKEQQAYRKTYELVHNAAGQNNRCAIM